MQGDEKAQNIFLAIYGIFVDKEEMRSKNKHEDLYQYKFYELHDGKMLYMLCQHSLFNRKNFPFLLCSCRRGDGVNNENHKCEIITHKKQIILWERSSRRWKDKRKRLKQDEKYEYFDHMNWVDTNMAQKGVSHFGIHPRYLPRESLRFDVFHLRCAITRRLMSFLWKFLMMHNVELIMDFSATILSTFWSNHNVLVWNLNKNFQSFVGTELLAFITNIPIILHFLKSNFHSTTTLKDLCNGLQLWQKITPFLVISTIENDKEYQKKC